MAADLVADQGMSNAQAALRAATGPTVFSAFGGGNARFNNSANVDLDAVNLLVGVGSRTGSLLLGGFFEAGTGSFDSSNSFSNAASVSASGSSEYYGLGVLGRYDIGEGSLSGAYVDGALRLGRSSLSYASNNLCDIGGQCASYHVTSNYVGAHIGAGYLLPLTTQTVIDFSSRYFWNHMSGTSLQVVGDPVTFDAITSSRWRNGLRFDYTLPNGLPPYIGAAYDYEYKGMMRASAYGLGLPSSDLGGGTSIAEVGMRYSGNNMHVELALQDYSGQRDGWGGHVAFKYQY